MKHDFVFLAVTALFVSCSSDSIKPVEPEDGYAFKAVVECVNKTSIDGTSVKWSKDDVVLVSDGTTQSRYVVTPLDSDATKGGLSLGEEEIALSEASAYYAVYPASYGASNDYREKGFLNEAASGTWGAYLPISHTASAGTFSKGTFPMISIAGKDKKFSFRNIASVVKVVPTCNLEGIRIQSIIFSASENMAGVLSVIYDGTSEPASSIVSGASKNINYRAKNGSNTCSYDEAIEFGNPCFFSIAPGTYSNLKLTINYVKENGATGSKVFTPNGSKTFVRNQINTINLPLEIIDNGLSSDGTSNCYVISKAGSYKFLANVRGNGVAVSGIGAMSASIDVSSIKGVKVIWDDNNVISGTPALEGDFITFKTPETFAQGNALIGVYSTSDCATGSCIWSWHIWASDVKSVLPTGPGSSSVEWMTYNLGGTSVDTGLYYQWGRKDPFTPTLSQAKVAKNQADVTAALSVANPDVFYTNTTTKNWCSTDSTPYDNKNFWNASRTSESAPSSSGVVEATPVMKTMFDPCPVGYRVPTHKNLAQWTYSKNSAFSTPYYTKDGLKLHGGLYWIGADGKMFSTNANRIAYWSNDAVSGYNNNAAAVLWAKSDAAQTTLHPTGTTQSESHGIMRHLGNQVRCCKE